MTTEPQLKLRQGLPTKKSLRDFFQYHGLDLNRFFYHADKVDISWGYMRNTQEELIQQLMPIFETYGFTCFFSPYKGEQLRRGYLRLSKPVDTAQTT